MTFLPQSGKVREITLKRHASVVAPGSRAINICIWDS